MLRRIYWKRGMQDRYSANDHSQIFDLTIHNTIISEYIGHRWTRTRRVTSTIHIRSTRTRNTIFRTRHDSSEVVGIIEYNTGMTVTLNDSNNRYNIAKVRYAVIASIDKPRVSWYIISRRFASEAIPRVSDTFKSLSQLVLLDMSADHAERLRTVSGGRHVRL